MKPLPSERQLRVGVAGAVPAHPQDSVLLEEGRGKSGIPGRNATQTTFCVTRQGLWPYLPSPRAQHQICKSQASGCSFCHLQETGCGG